MYKKEKRSSIKKMMNIFQKIRQFFFDLILPARCAKCGAYIQGDIGLCATCFSKLNFIEQPFCYCCGFPFELADGMETDQNFLCGACLKKRPFFQKARSALCYDHQSRDMILSFKHADHTELAPFFGFLLYRIGQDLLSQVDLVIPVPLHRKRLMQRRYNQSALLAQALAKHFSIKIAYHILQRKKFLSSQGHFNKKQRQKNVRSAFDVHHAKEIKGKKFF